MMKRHSNRILQLSTIFLFLLYVQACTRKVDIITISQDGSWCWFSDPRAIYTSDGNILTGWVSSDGSIESGLINLRSGTITKQVLSPQLEKDDHDNPAFLSLPDDEYMVFYAKHVNEFLYYHHSKDNDETLFSEVNTHNPVSKEELEKFPRSMVTYANPFLLTEENNRIYCFGRWTGFKPNIMWSDDLGKSFSHSKVFIAEEGFRAGNRPYVKYFSDGKSKIHFVFTDGHPRVEALNSVYYAYYEKGAFFRIDGSKICSMDEIPFKPDEASIIYRATNESGRAWVHDIAVDEKGDIAILYARYPTEEEHHYYYATFIDGTLEDHFICNAGKWFPQTPDGDREREPHYSGLMTVNPLKLNEIYVSREISGVFEIEKLTTNDRGHSWDSTPITKNSTLDNVRPFVPRNMRKGDNTVVLWMENEYYVHYTDFKSRIKLKLD